MVRPVELALAEILSEIDWATETSGSLSQEAFAKDRAVRYIVERSLEIISEASRRIPVTLKESYPEIDGRGMGEIGNFLRHEYHSTSANIVWSVVKSDLPRLRLVIEAMLSTLDE